MTPAAALTFDLPRERAATEPPEARGLRRDGVRLLAATPHRIRHARFHDIGRLLAPGDLVVVNTSATVPAAVDGVRAGGRPVVVHFSTALDAATWTVELRSPDASGPLLDGAAGESIELAGGARLTIVSAYAGVEGRSRLLEARVDVKGQVLDYLRRLGRPIAYDYLRGQWPLSAYQTVFATEPGSVEMPSAGRPFSAGLVTRLLARGVGFAPIVLHTGVSSLRAGEAPPPERFSVPPATARLVNHTRKAKGAVVAAGTTVTRALETAADEDGIVAPARGWTELTLAPERPARVVDGLITGWHAPDASHHLLLEAVAGPELVGRAYEAALKERYLWHEFGDSCLLLPADRNRS